MPRMWKPLTGLLLLCLLGGLLLFLVTDDVMYLVGGLAVWVLASAVWGSWTAHRGKP